MLTPERREGRGRLSSIDVLPDDAEPDVRWADEQLRERKLPANAILVEFNKRLADRGIASISKSAWSRYSVRKAIRFRELDLIRRLSNDVTDSLGPTGSDEVTTTIAEMVKVNLFQSLERGELTPKEAMEAARALAAVVSAQRLSAEHRKRLEEKINAEVEQAADRAVALAKEAGLSADRIAQMRRDVLGLRVAS